MHCCAQTWHKNQRQGATLAGEPPWADITLVTVQYSLQYSLHCFWSCYKDFTFFFLKLLFWILFLTFVTLYIVKVLLYIIRMAVCNVMLWYTYSVYGRHFIIAILSRVDWGRWPFSVEMKPCCHFLKPYWMKRWRVCWRRVYVYIEESRILRRYICHLMWLTVK